MQSATFDVYLENSIRKRVIFFAFRHMSSFFSNEVESSLAFFLKTYSSMYHCLTPKATRKLAYELPKKTLQSSRTVASKEELWIIHIHFGRHGRYHNPIKVKGGSNKRLASSG